jgi:hypothetical protein
MRRPQPAGADFFLYAWVACEWARTCSYTRGRKVTGRRQKATGRKQNANGRGRVLPHEVNSGIGHIHNNEQEH